MRNRRVKIKVRSSAISALADSRLASLGQSLKQENIPIFLHSSIIYQVFAITVDIGEYPS